MPTSHFQVTNKNRLLQGTVVAGIVRYAKHLNDGSCFDRCFLITIQSSTDQHTFIFTFSSSKSKSTNKRLIFFFSGSGSVISALECCSFKISYSIFHTSSHSDF